MRDTDPASTSLAAKLSTLFCSRACNAWLSLLAWALALLALWQLVGEPSAPAYELSTYDALPPLFRNALQASFALQVFVAARVSFRRDRDRVASLPAISGIAGVIFATVVVLCLPQLRGYFSLSGDFSTHVARSVEFSSVWNIDEYTFYPALYSLVQAAHAAAGLDTALIWSLGNVIWYLLYVLICIMVAGSLLNNRRAALFAGLGAAIPIAGTYLRTMSPASVSVQLLPLLFYLYTRSRHRKAQGFTLLLVLLLVLLPFLHPLTSLMAIVWLALLEVAKWALPQARFWRQSVNSPRMRASFAQEPLALTAALILAVTWLAWISSFWLWTNNIRQIATWLTGEAHTQLARIDYLADRSGLPTPDLAEVVLKQGNGLIVYTGLAFASALLFVLLARRQRVGARLAQYLTPLSALLTVSVLAAGFAVIGPFGNLDFFRFSRFLIPWAVLILAVAPLLASLAGSRARLLIASLMLCALIVVALGGFWALHPSPWAFRPNDQMTVHEVVCMRRIYWVGDDRDLRGIWNLRHRADIALGSSTARWLPSIWDPLPDHFGYDVAPSLDGILARPTYLLITEYDRATVLDLWASAEKYTKEDFIQLEEDSAAVLLYANGGCEIWASGALEEKGAP